VKVLSVTTVATAVAIAIGAIMSATPAPAANCKAIVYGDTVTGRVFQRLLLEPRAKRSWASKVRSRHGAGYTSWSLAQDKDIRCTRTKPDRMWSCRAFGRPCKA
jgi:hypothetical protein